jgi:hypothetical protein
MDLRDIDGSSVENSGRRGNAPPRTTAVTTTVAEPCRLDESVGLTGGARDTYLRVDHAPL